MRFRPLKDYYSILNIHPAATVEEIKKAYRRQAKQSHPDRAGTGETERFLLIKEARDMLTDLGKKRVYDSQRAQRTGVPDTWEGPRPMAMHDLSFIRTVIKKRPGSKNPIKAPLQKITIERNQCVMCQGDGVRQDRFGRMKTCPWCGGSGGREKL